MKKITMLLFSCFGILIFSGCSNSESMMDYVDVSFEGIDTMGEATYVVDEEKLLQEVFDYDEEKDFLDEKTLKEIEAIKGAYKINIDKEKELTNGDTIKLTITVDDSKTKKIKGGEKEFKVEGLEEPNKLTNEEIEKNVIVNFNGVSGRGEAQLETTFNDPLSDLEFEVDGNGKLKNEDKVIISLAEGSEETLNSNGYILADDGKVSFEVSGLQVVPEKAVDIENLEDIERMMKEGITREYQDFDPEQGWGRKYEIKLESKFYRQFTKDSSNDEFDNSWDYQSSDNGNLVGVYTIKEYAGGAEGKLEEEFIVVYGFTNIILNDKREANVTEIEEVIKKYDDTYSLESVLKLMEGYGYSAIE